MKQRMVEFVTALMVLAMLTVSACNGGGDTTEDGDVVSDGDDADDIEVVEEVDVDPEPDGDIDEQPDGDDPDVEDTEEDVIDDVDPEPDGDIDEQPDGDEPDIEEEPDGDEPDVDVDPEPDGDDTDPVEETEEDVIIPDTTPPEVAATVPIDQSQQPIDLETIRIELSEKLAPASIDWTAIHLHEQGHSDTPILFNGSHDDFSSDVSVLSLTVATSNAFAYYATYEVVIDGDVFADLAETPNYLAAYSFTFTIVDDPDPVPPTVEQMTPADGATGVAIDLATIIIDFDEPLADSPFDWAGVQVYPQGCDNSGCYLDVDKVRSEETDPADHTRFTLSLNPAEVLDWETVYVVHLDGDTFWDTGDNLLAETTLSFTTVVNPDPIAPVIAEVTPADGAVDVPKDTDTITIDFSEVLDPPFTWAGLRVYLQACGDQSGCYVPYAHVDSTETGDNGDVTRFVLTLRNPVVYSGTYVLHFDADTYYDLNGNALGEGNPVETTFTIENEPDVTAPFIVTSIPQNNSIGVSADLDLIQINFNEELAEASIDYSGIVVRPESCGDAGCHIAFTGSHSSQTNPDTQKTYTRLELTVSPDDFDFSTAYVVAFAADTFSDLSDNFLEATSLGFITEIETDTTAPVIESTSPADGETGVAKDILNLYVTFSERLSATAFNLDWVTVYPQGSPGTPVEVTKIRRELVEPTSIKTQIEMTVIQLGGLAYGTSYVIEVQNGVFQDLAGNVMEGQNVFTFTVEDEAVDGDEDVVDEEPELEPEIEEEPPATGTISGTLYTTQTLLFDLQTIQLFNQPPVDATVAPYAEKTNPATNPVAGTAFYSFTDLPAGTYWVRAWIDTNINSQIDPLTEWAMHTADPIALDPEVTPTVMADMYYGVSNSSLGEMSGRIYLPEGAFSTDMAVYVKVFREDPDTTSTAPVAVSFGGNPSGATRSFSWLAENLANGDHWVRGYVDVCNDGDESNDVLATHSLTEPLVIADNFISGIDITFDDAAALACPSDGDVDVDEEPEVEEEIADVDVTGCNSDNDCDDPDHVCHFQAEGGLGACALPCTSDTACQNLFGESYFCGPSENLIRRCYDDVTLPVDIPDAPDGPLDILFSVSDSGTIAQQACLTVNIEHADMGEIWIRLVSADGSRADDVYYFEDPGVADLDTTISVLSFNGENRGGFWHLIIEDSTTGNAGRLLSYSLAFDDACPALVDGDTDIVDTAEEEDPPRPGSCEAPYSSSVIGSEMTGIDSLMDPTGCTNITDASGPDRVHAFSLTQDVPFSVTVTSYGQFDVVLYIMNPCSNSPTICEGVDANINTSPETLNFTPSIGGTYYLVVDSKGDASGDYELTVN